MKEGGSEAVQYINFLLTSDLDKSVHKAVNIVNEAEQEKMSYDEIRFGSGE